MVDQCRNRFGGNLGVLQRCLVGALWLLICAWPGWVAASEVAQPSLELKAKIKQLIDDLGAAEFQVREAAETELSAMGLTAYEALLEVRNHQDIEVRLRARHIVDALRGNFMIDGLPDDIGAVLKDYHTKSVAQRTMIVANLARLLPQQGADALARIARFEADERLSRLAAVSILSVPLKRQQTSTALIEALSSGIGFSDRTAVQWLRAYADSHRGKEGVLDLWQLFIEEESTRNLELEETEEAREEYRTALQKIAIDVAQVTGQEDRAAELKRELTKDLETSLQHLEWLEWLQQRLDWQSIIDFSRSHQEMFDTEPLLLYGLAEAQLKLGQSELAEQTAAQARDVQLDDPSEHYRFASWLKSGRGLYDWSEIEYRQCIASSEPTEDNYYRGVIWLGELLHELDRDGEAADLLDETLRLLILAKEDQKDREKFRQLQTRLKAMQRVRTRQDMQARAIFFRATHYRRLGDREKELEELSKGIKQTSDDVDLLIAMHTVEEPTAEWKQLTSEKIRAVNARFRREVHDMFDSYEKARTNPPQREIFRAGLAQVLNQYAWLVGNTEGDIDEAIRNSHKSLEFAMGEGGYLDTLARCYYRAGKLDEALKYQAMAVERAPHELQIQKQLEVIRAAIAQQSQATGEPEPVVVGADSN